MKKFLNLISIFLSLSANSQNIANGTYIANDKDQIIRLILKDNNYDLSFTTGQYEIKKDFTDSWNYTVEDAAILGQEYVISPWLDDSYRKTYDDLKRYMEVFNKSGELCKKSGMKFGYHNHDFEFSQKLNDIKVFDIIMQNTDPSLVAQQLDIGNMYIGGAKALDVVTKYSGKFEMIHVKDEIASNNAEKWESAILGKGVIQVKEVLDICRKTGGTQVYIIEQESYQGKAPLACIEEDLKIMKNWGY